MGWCIKRVVLSKQILLYESKIISKGMNLTQRSKPKRYRDGLKGIDYALKKNQLGVMSEL